MGGAVSVKTDQRGWLVLNRKAGEKILVGDDMVVSINWVRGKMVSVAVYAPGKKIIRAEKAQLGGQSESLSERPKRSEPR